MSWRRYVIAAFISLALIFMVGLQALGQKSTEELFYVASLRAERGSYIQRKTYFAYVRYLSIEELRKRSLTPHRSLILSAIDVANGNDIDDSAMRDLLKILLHKGEDIGRLSVDCNYVDRLVMSSDVSLMLDLVRLGLVVPIGGESKVKCDENLVGLLERYKSKYTIQEYKLMREMILTGKEPVTR